MQYTTPQGVAIHAGFPNPAADTQIQGIDLNKYLIQHSVGTYFMRIGGNLWRDFGIFNNDVVIIDRVLYPQKNDLVIWWEGDSFVLGHRASLPAETECWGVVTTAIHQYVTKDISHEERT
jgi:DNA polymerase V